jgi:multidrug efflux pump subunit AcrA (membrane-fusion protein)
MTNRTRTLFLVLAVVLSTFALTTYTYRARLGPYMSALFSRAGMQRATNDVQKTANAQPSDQTPRASVEIDPRRQQLVGVRTVAARRAPLDQKIRAVGLVRYDETRQADVNLKVEGYIRDLYVDYTGQPIQKGQPLFTLYSPDLLSTQSEYLLALKTREQMQQSQIADARERADALVAAARQRLVLWDLPPEAIVELERTREPRTAVVFRSPATVFVVDKQAVAGMHVMPGQTLYKIADTSVVWVEADLYEAEVPLVRIGQAATVTLDAYPDSHYVGRVIYIYPYVDEKTRTNKVRYQFSNQGGRLKPGMYANVEINTARGQGIVVPANAVLDSGKEQIVFVTQGDGHFEPRQVKVGRRSGEDVEILEGVREGEQVAAGAAFFLDSESQLRGSLQSYQTPPSPGGSSTSQSRLSITFHSMPDPPKAGENQFEVSVKDPAGTPIDGAEVTLQFFMAAMPTMNMPAMKNDIKLSAAGAGTYRGTGPIMTAGRWDMTIGVSRNGQRVGSKQLSVVTQ